MESVSEQMDRPTFERTWAVLAQTMGYYGHNMVEMEKSVWANLINRFGERAITNFLKWHMGTAVFPPKIGEAMKLLAPGLNNTTGAYEALSRKVAHCGPYQTPSFDDTAIARAVVLLGGWVAVSETMPVNDGSFESSAFIKRFDAAYEQARAEQVLQREQPVMLRSLHDVSRARVLLGNNQPEPVEGIGQIGHASDLLAETAHAIQTALPPRMRE